MKLFRHIKRFKRDESGVAIVEFMIVMPMTFFMLALLLDFGRVFWGYQEAIAGVRDASRYLARIAPVDMCLTGQTLDQYENTLKSMIEEDVEGTAILPGGITVTEVNATHVCVDDDFRTSPAAVATVSADMTMQFMLSGWFDIIGDGLGTVTTTVADSSKVYGQ